MREVTGYVENIWGLCLTVALLNHPWDRVSVPHQQVLILRNAHINNIEYNTTLNYIILFIYLVHLKTLCNKNIFNNGHPILDKYHYHNILYVPIL